MDDKPDKNRQDEALSPKDSTSSDKPAEENSPQQLDNSKQGSQQQEIPAPESDETEGSYHDQAQNQDDELMEILAGEDIDKILSDSESALLGDAENSDQLAEDAALETIATDTESQQQTVLEADEEAPADIEIYEDGLDDNPAEQKLQDEQTQPIEPILTESSETDANSAVALPTETQDHPKAERTSNQLEIDDILSKSEDGEFIGFGMGILASDEQQAQDAEAEKPDIQPAETKTSSSHNIEESDDHKTLSDADIDALFESDTSEVIQQSDNDQPEQEIQSESLSAEELDELFGQALETGVTDENSSSDTEITAQLNEDSALLDDEVLPTIETPENLEDFETDETEPADDVTEIQTDIPQEDTSGESAENMAQTSIETSSQTPEDLPEDAPLETQATVINVSPDMAEQILSENSSEDEDTDDSQNLTAEDIERLINESTGSIESATATGESMDDVESLAAMAVDGVSEDSNANFMTMSDLDELLGRDPADHMSRAASTLTNEEIDHYSNKYGAEVASLDDLDELFGKSATTETQQANLNEQTSESQESKPPQVQQDQSDEQFGEIAMLTQDQLDELFNNQAETQPTKDDEPSDVSEALTKGELNQLLNAADQTEGKTEAEQPAEPEADTASPIAQVSQEDLDELLKSYEPSDQKSLAKPEIAEKAKSGETTGESAALNQEDLDKLFEATAATVDQLASEDTDVADDGTPQSLNQDELDKLFAQAAGGQGDDQAETEATETDQTDDSESLNQDDLDRLFEAADKLSAEAIDETADTDAEQDTDDTTSLSQDELDKLFSQAGGQDDTASTAPEQPQAQTSDDDSASLSQDELDKLFDQASGIETEEAAAIQPETQNDEDSASLSQNELDELFAQAGGTDSSAEPAADVTADESTSLDQDELDKLFAEAGGGAPAAPEDDWSTTEDQPTDKEPQVENLDEIISQSIDSSDIVSEEQQLQQILQQQQKQTDEVVPNNIPVPEPQEAQAEATALLSDKPEPVELPVNNFDDLQTLLAHRDQHGLPADEEDKAAAAAAQAAAQQAGSSDANTASVSVPLKLKLYRLVVKLNSPFDKLPDSYKEYAAYAAMALISASMFLLLAAKIR